MKLVGDYYKPKPSVIVQRYKFNMRVRKQGESVATYVAALRELAEHCSYGTTLKEMLRDRLVCGVNHEGIQRKLLGEKNLTYETALTLAQSIETAERESKDLRLTNPPRTSQGIHYNFRGSKPRKNAAGDASVKPKVGNIVCYRCGGPHLAPACKFKETQYLYCKKKGHLARVCRAKAQGAKGSPDSKRSNYLEAQEDDSAYTLFTLHGSNSNPITLDLALNNVPVKVELDTGAAVSVISHSTYLNICSQSQAVPALQPSLVKLKTYTGELIPIVGCASLQARYGTQVVDVHVQVVEGDGPNLLGRDLLQKLEVDLGSVNANVLEQTTPMEGILDKHSIVFSEELGCMNGPAVQLQIDDKVQPKFFKPRTVPYILKEKVETELQRLEKLGIISPIKFSKWAAPVVPVMKKNNTVRLCGDYKLTANKALLTECYPLPRVDDLVTALAGGKCFTKLDMSNAYLQLPVDESFKEYLVINTHKGLFQYNRLPFGISSAPAIFQCCMDSLLQGIPRVSVYLDDILITGSTMDEHLQNLEAVLGRLHDAGLHLNQDKCTFMQPKIEYLGHVIDEQGRHPTEEKIQAILHQKT